MNLTFNTVKEDSNGNHIKTEISRTLKVKVRIRTGTLNEQYYVDKVDWHSDIEIPKILEENLIKLLKVTKV